MRTLLAVLLLASTALAAEPRIQRDIAYADLVQPSGYPLPGRFVRHYLEDLRR